MKATELRIGNFVKYYEGQFTGEILAWKISHFSHEGNTVYVSESEAGGYTSTELKDLSPILLTEGWLEKLGFKYRKCTGYGGQDQWAGLGFISNGKVNFRGHPGLLKLEGFFNTRIEYVHQLQNLYFAITGEELTPTVKPIPA